MMEEAGEEAEEAEATEEATQEDCDCRDSDCEELAQKIKDRLHANKRAPNAGGSQNHGLFPRRLEQICGAHGPGSESWTDHADNIAGDQDDLRSLVRQFDEKDCRGHPEDGINWGEVEEALSPDFNPSPGQHLGRNHAMCDGVGDMMRNGQSQEAVDRLRYWELQGGASGQPMS